MASPRDVDARLHHVGAFVDDFEATVTFHRDTFGAELLSTETLDGVLRIAFMRLPTHEVHMLSRKGRDSPEDAILDELEPYRYHVAYEVPDVRKAIKAVEAAGIEMLQTEPARADLRPWERAFSDPEATLGPLFELLKRVGEKPPAFP
jgi:catechol 2,3-dioxygenase-like lactoylglutathione lyase family enzyme